MFSQTQLTRWQRHHSGLHLAVSGEKNLLMLLNRVLNDLSAAPHQLTGSAGPAATRLRKSRELCSLLGVAGSWERNASRTSLSLSLKCLFRCPLLVLLDRRDYTFPRNPPPRCETKSAAEIVLFSPFSLSQCLLFEFQKVMHIVPLLKCSHWALHK